MTSNTSIKRAAVYLRVSTDGQTTDNQRLDLERLCQLRGWDVVKVYEDAGISGSKGRDQRPGLDALLKDARRRRFDVAVFWSVDRLGRSTAHVTTIMDELEGVGVAQFYFKESMDTSTPHGRAMLEMAAVFARLERGMIRERVNAGLARAKAQGKTLGRPKSGDDIEARIRTLRAEGKGILKIAREVGCGVSVVQRVVKEAETETAEGT
ncbi:recombinase family protein [Azospirillum soli]|uniref:recombinase family protein n=1 Tax=Azospirillum soli TaxID=1304799 RepID=UPI001AE60BBA|nr:recombinase family protein [Azospirillum soli]MBP2312985.1 DNA invertase Pin-like site-specific DNA recombinase [Azospirillum soli]